MKTIGVLGGGQLSKLLALRGKTLGLKVFVLSPKKQDPSAQQNPLWIKGNPNNQNDLKHFFKQVDLITFESEFFPANKIKKTLQNLKGKKPYIAPSLKALSLIQDRLTQKKLLSQYKIDTADFSKKSLTNITQKKLLKLWEKFGPFVLKTRVGGYDGYGTFIIRKKSQIKNKSFPSGSFIAEKFIPFKRELALLVARNKKSKIIFFPLVESFQKKSRCLWVKGPVYHKKLSSFKKQIKNMLNGIDYQGVIAFELFDTGDNLLVNELAPRVHNSGHYSIDVLNEDQFAIHLKAIMNCPLSQPKTLNKSFAMLNLLGEGTKKPSLKLAKKKHDLKKIYKTKELSLKVNQDIQLCWYGKTVSRKGRKMGHINAIDNSPSKALNKLLKARTLFKV